MARLMLSDELWSKLKEIMLQHQIYNKPNLRTMVEAMLYRMRVGCPWRDLPVEFGFWHSIYQQFKGKEMKSFYVYIMANGRNGTLYVGSTSDLVKRAWEHKNKVIPGFTARYNVHILVFYEVHETYVEAARREKRFKNWRRQWKLNLIEKLNPEWHDLYEDICC